MNETNKRMNEQCCIIDIRIRNVLDLELWPLKLVKVKQKRPVWWCCTVRTSVVCVQLLQLIMDDLYEALLLVALVVLWLNTRLLVRWVRGSISQSSEHIWALLLGPLHWQASSADYVLYGCKKLWLYYSVVDICGLILRLHTWRSTTNGRSEAKNSRRGPTHQTREPADHSEVFAL